MPSLSCQADTILAVMSALSTIPKWTIAAPISGWILLAGVQFDFGAAYSVLLTAGLIACVVAGVHHAEVVAHRVGEPYGTLTLAVAITIIEVALIVSLMLAGGPSTVALARDTVFAAVMIILNGIVGLCLLVGGSRFREQVFGLYGVNAALVTLAAIAVLTMILPNYTVSTPGPVYSSSQLAFIAVVSLVLYSTFVLMQTVSHRDYFLPDDDPADEERHAARPDARVTMFAVIFMLVSLVAVVLLAKALAPGVESALDRFGAPKALVGIIIAAVVLMPEGLAALRAAKANRLQTSLNLALGSALASIGLTIPTVALVSLTTGWTLTLGLDVKSSLLFLLSLFVTTMTLGTGRTTLLHGVVHLVLFAVYLFTTIVP